jgi:ornithine lipid hydroxylase
MTSESGSVDLGPRRSPLLAMVWPGVMMASMAAFWWLTVPLEMSNEMALQVHFLLLFAGILLLEWLIPQHKSWNKYDRQGWNDFLYNITFPAAQIGATLIVLKVTAQDQSANVDMLGMGLPAPVQFILMILLVDLIWYCYHRAFHTFPMLWRLHSLHHNSNQLHVLNNARIHPLEVFVLFLVIMAAAEFVNVPPDVLSWYFAFQLTVGLLTHSNVAVRTGWLSWIFNTPELHHWHHSRVRKEHDNNYGSVSMTWDHLFGTYFNPRDRQASEDIGADTPVPTGWFGQLLMPIRREGTGSLAPSSARDKLERS